MGETLGVESPPERPETAPKPKRRRRSTGKIKPEHINIAVTQLFAGMAMLKDAKYWAIQDEKIELDGWTPSAAELINEYVSEDTAQKVIAGNAGLTVAFGMLLLVGKRLQLDAQYKQHKRLLQARDNRETLQRQEGIKRPQQATESSTQHVPGTGATPTHPTKISGLSGPM